jgi:hypothetical protein
MNDESEWYEAFGASVERPAWSWSYLRKPTPLFLWLACAALCSFLAERKPRAQSHGPAGSQPEPRQHAGLHVLRGEGQATARDDRDDDARAA